MIKGSLFPIPKRLERLWDIYHDIQSDMWPANEIDYDGDVIYWLQLDDNIRRAAISIFNLFVNADKMVAHIIEDKIKEHFKNEDTPHIQHILDFIESIENIHTESYSRYVDVVVRSTNPDIADKILGGQYPINNQIFEWCMDKYNKYSEDIRMLMVVHSIVEGIFFTGPFAVVDWLKDRLPNLKKQNDFVSKDEGKHVLVDQTILLYLGLPDNKVIYDLYKEGVDIACNIIVTNILPDGDRLLMTKDILSRHIMYVADRQLELMGLQPMNPDITSTDLLNMLGYNVSVRLTDFFDLNPTEYSRKIIDDGFGDI